nr:DMT family transporter [Burkholderia multivorans]
MYCGVAYAHFTGGGSSVIHFSRSGCAVQKTTDGWLSGLLGVIIFSGSLPATRVAVQGLDPLFLTFARATIAGALGLLLLAALKQKRPTRGEVASLLVVALGVVIGFPLLTALALRHVTSAHAIVFVGLLPLATALFGVWRGGERPRAPFWAFSLLGSGAVAAFALRNGGQASALGDALMLAAIVACGLGYAEGARLSRDLGGWQVISWALVLSLPLMLPLAWITRPATFDGIDTAALWGLAYVSLFSMLIGFVFWYRGLALGGIAGVGQLQLLQPFFGFVLAAGVLHETVPPSMVAVTAIVVGCVAGAKYFSKAVPVQRAG